MVASASCPQQFWHRPSHADRWSGVSGWLQRGQVVMVGFYPVRGAVSRQFRNIFRHIPGFAVLHIDPPVPIAVPTESGQPLQGGGQFLFDPVGGVPRQRGVGVEVRHMDADVHDHGGFLSGDFAVVVQVQSHASVRALQVVDHACVEQFLKQAHGFFVREFAVFILDQLGGEVHAGSIST